MEVNNPIEYVVTRERLRRELLRAVEQVDKDQHLNAATLLARAQSDALYCLNFFLKGGKLADVRRVP